MATLRQATGSIFGAVTETAETVVSILNTVSTSAKMMNDFVENARMDQLYRIEAGKHHRKAIILSEKTMEVMAAQQQLEDYIGNDNDRKIRVEEIYNKMQQSLDELDEKMSKA